MGQVDSRGGDQGGVGRSSQPVTPAHCCEWSLAQADHHSPGATIAGLVEKGELPEAWHLSDDSNRMVPLLLPESQWLIVVAGDPLNNRSCIYRQNFKQGDATSKRVRLPANWAELRKVATVP